MIQTLSKQCIILLEYICKKKYFQLQLFTKNAPAVERVRNHQFFNGRPSSNIEHISSIRVSIDFLIHKNVSYFNCKYVLQHNSFHTSSELTLTR